MNIAVSKNKHNKLIGILIYFIVIISCQYTYAKHEITTVRLTSGASTQWYNSGSLTPTNTSLNSNAEWFFNQLGGTDASWNSKYKFYNIKDKVVFGIDNTKPLCLEDYDAKVVITVDYINQDETATPTETIELWVKYRKNGGVDLQLFDMYTNTDGYVFQEITIDQIDFYTPLGAPLTGFWPENLYVDNVLEYDIYKDITLTTDYPGVMGTGSNFNSNFKFIKSPSINDRIALVWPEIFAAEEYLVEWTWVSDADENSNSGNLLHSATLKYDFLNNATRITTKSNSFEIPLIYEKGYIVARIKPLGRDINNPTIVTELKWNTDDEMGPVNFVGEYVNAGTTSYGPYYYYINGFESKLNWQHSIGFAEDGKTKQLISYFDGTLRKRQSVTRVNSTDSVAIVGETIYDSQGRPAIEVLPVPAQVSTPQSNKNNKQLTFYNKFNRPENAGSRAYDYRDFDENPLDDCTPTADGMNTNSGSSKYYSPSNLDATGVNEAVPDAENFPFIQTQYTPDNTGRVSATSGVGETHKLGSEHATKYFYATPLSEQLFRLFGNEVGKNVHYQKEAVKDANGTISVTYKDASGKVIATALAGDATVTSNLEPLPSSNSPINVNSDLLSNNKTDNSGPLWKIESITNHFVATKGNHSFTYELDRETFTDECLPEICFDCIYDLKISITDECGTSLIPGYSNGITQTIGLVDEICDEGLHFELNPEPLTIELEVGIYIITKTLSINPQAIDEYWKLYLENNTCIKTLDDFETESIDAIDFSSCNVDCATCVSSLGLYTDHNDITKTDPEDESYDPAYVYLTEGQYNALIDNCNELCDNSGEGTNCDIYRALLESDVSPGGQYAAVNQVDGNLTLVLDDPYSIFYDGTGYVKHYTTLTYHIDGIDTNDEIVVELNGTTKHINELTEAEFLLKFDESWLPALIKLHPEYCRFNYLCTDLAATLDYSYNITNTTNYEDALTAGYYNPANNTLIPSPWNTTTTPDPLYATIGTSGINGLLNAVPLNGGTDNAWDFATLAAGNTASNTHWNIFKGLYLKYKNQLLDELIEEECPIVFQSNVTFGGAISQRIFFSAEDAYVAGGVVGAGDIDWENPEDIADLANQQTLNTFNSQCDATANVIISQLRNCIIENDGLHESAEQVALDADLAVLKTKLVTICQAGYNPANPVPVAVSSEGSFANEIGDFFVENGYTPSSNCNEMSVSLPPPVGFGNARPLDDCACDKLTTLQNDYQALVSTSSLPPGVVTLDDYSQHIYGYRLNVDDLLQKCKVMSVGATGSNVVKPKIRGDLKEIVSLHEDFKLTNNILETDAWQNTDFGAFSAYVNTNSTIYTTTDAAQVRNLLKRSYDNVYPFSSVANETNINAVKSLLDTLISLNALRDTAITGMSSSSALKTFVLDDGGVFDGFDVEVSRPKKTMQFNRGRYILNVEYPAFINDTASITSVVYISIAKDVIDTTTYTDTLNFGVTNVDGVLLCDTLAYDSLGSNFSFATHIRRVLTYNIEPSTCFGDTITMNIYEVLGDSVYITPISIPVLINPYLGDGIDILFHPTSDFDFGKAISLRTANGGLIDVSTLTAGTHLTPNNLATGSNALYTMEVGGNPLDTVNFDLTSSFQLAHNARSAQYLPDPGNGNYCSDTDLSKAPFILSTLANYGYNRRVMPASREMRDTLVNLFNTEFGLVENWTFYERFMGQIFNGMVNTQCTENNAVQNTIVTFLNGVLNDGYFTPTIASNVTGKAYINTTLYPNIGQSGFAASYTSYFSGNNYLLAPKGAFQASLADNKGFVCKTVNIAAPVTFEYWNKVIAFSNMRPVTTTGNTNQFLIDITFEITPGVPTTVTFEGSLGCGLTLNDCVTTGPIEETTMIPADLSCGSCITCGDALEAVNWVYKQLPKARHDDMNAVFGLLRYWIEYKNAPNYLYTTPQSLLYAYQQCNIAMDCDTTYKPLPITIIEDAVLVLGNDDKLDQAGVVSLGGYASILTDLGYTTGDVATCNPTATIYKKSNTLGITNLQVIFDDACNKQPARVYNFSYPSEYAPSDFTDFKVRRSTANVNSDVTLLEGDITVSSQVVRFWGGIGQRVITCNNVDDMEICPDEMPNNAPDIENACSDDLINTALTNAYNAYQDYITDLNIAFVKQYTDKCITATEKWDMDYADHEYHFTLYYYDRAGNLIKTVPPAGVALLDATQIANAIAFANGASGSSRVFTAHTYNTNYQMSSLNQPVWQKTPDAEEVKFYYDPLGRVVLSQSGKQRITTGMLVTHNYSYTLYDALGRIVEVGEVTTVSPSTLSALLNNYNTFKIYDGDPGNDFTSFIAAQTRRQVTRTTYDAPLVNIDGFEQKNLRNRVAAITVSEVYADANTDGRPDAYDHASHYTYDVNGNVDRIVQEYPGLDDYGKRFFTLDYEYDLVSGKVNTVTYQKNQADQFIHTYKYDADNRITTARTSRDGNVYYNNAGYDYYMHGPLKRIELGSGEANNGSDAGTIINWPVQGLDFAYTAQGWIKGMNSDVLNPDDDLGQDGAAPTSPFAKDAFGYTVGYFNGDYKPIGQTQVSFVTNATAFAAPGLYNGNISRVTNALMKVDNSLMEVQGNGYKYDQLNRLVDKTVYPLVSGTYQTASNNYKEEYSYDANGNIQTLLRHGTSAVSMQQVEMDSLNYHYTAGTNRLAYVDDNTAYALYYGNDIEDQSSGNYDYDDNGNLIKDVNEEIATIEWNVYGKIKSITRSTGSLKPGLEFVYGPDGNRLLKIVKDPNKSHWEYTYYVRDAQGNIMATYSVKHADSKWRMAADEFVMYGSSRLGVVKNATGQLVEAMVAPATYASDPESGISFIKDLELPEVPVDLSYALLQPHQFNYEITNFRGDVQAVVTADSKTACTLEDEFTAYLPQIQTVTDYYSFGSPMKNRTDNQQDYRFGFNGKENDNETYGIGNALDFGARIYDNRLGRWMSKDPAEKKYPSHSPYNAYANNPIYYIDMEGCTLKVVTSKENKNYTIASNDIKNMVPKDYRSFISIADDGIVKFNMTKEQAYATNDPGVLYMYQATNASKMLTYDVSNEVYKDLSYGGRVTEATKPTPLTWVANLSKTPLIPGQPVFVPHDKNVDGSVTIPADMTHVVSADDSDKSRESIVFHELWENYFRTVEENSYYGDGGKPRTKDTPDKYGPNSAHQKTIDLEKQLSKTDIRRDVDSEGAGKVKK